MREIFVVALIAHGIAHIAGFMAYARLVRIPPAAYRSYLLRNRWRVSPEGERTLGIAWLILALGFFVTAGGVGLERAWWSGFVLCVASASLAMCVIGLPSSWIGAVVDVALIATVLLRG